MPEEPTLQGWVPVLSHDMTLAKVVDMAFDYRGNVTIFKNDGSEVTGYVFNRDQSAVAPFLEYFDEAGGGPHRLHYYGISNISFTGRDMALGTSWEAWRSRKVQATSRNSQKAG